ncbi:putative methyltransferase PMT26 [Raphanus sativus]|nr:putative methyltransferase PMT26 [Raphanus sativus]
MAQPRYTRIDNRRPSSSGYCSTVTIVVFVALCLVGLWMMTSSSLGPDQSVNLDNKDGMKNQMTPPAEEGNGQKPEEATGKTPNGESSSKEEEKEEKTKEESSSSGETEGGENKKDDGSDPDEKKDLNEENSDSTEKQTKPETEDNESGEDGENQTKFEGDESEKKSSDDDKETKTGNEGDETKPDKENTKTSVVEQESQPKNETSGGAQLELVNETVAQNGSFPTQATESKKEKEAQKSSGDQIDFEWKVCNTTAGPDYIPCLDNVQAIRSLKSTKHYEHRERHCPDSPPTCLVPLPEGYKRPIEWPKSREKIWYTNVPHTKLAEYKGHQNWVKVTGEYLTFPGGGTQFKHGALHYIDFIQESVSDIAWGNARSRVWYWMLDAVLQALEVSSSTET